MSEKLLSTDQILTILASTPDHIRSFTAGVAPETLRAAPGLDEWSANDVLAHLRSCADVWDGCMARILAEDHPTIRAVNPRTWINQTDYPDQPFEASLRSFVQQRDELLARLRPLDAAAWERSATITGAGRALERTVQSYGSWLARHERPHVKQIDKIVNRLAVGE